MIRNTGQADRTVLRRLSRICDELAAEFLSSRSALPAGRSLDDARAEISLCTGRELADPALADMLAQSLVLSRVAWRLASPKLHAFAGQLALLPHSSWLLRATIAEALEWTPGDHHTRSAGLRPFLEATDAVAGTARGTELDFDLFLAAHDPRGRSRHGVYFTPQPLARFIVGQADRFLKAEFGLPSGLADSALRRDVWADTNASPRTAPDCPFVQILDPAAGTGVFLLEVIARAYESFAAAHGDTEPTDAWNEFVGRDWLARLRGCDLLLPACVVAWIRVADALARTGYRFDMLAPIRVELSDSLRPVPSQFDRNGNEDTDSQHAEVTSVVLGNPPFAALTTSGNAWIDELLRARDLAGQSVGSYYEVDGEPLREKKLWLHDDYVKFLRYSQWQVERSGAGVVGLVTNHGYLDNLTFRGVRQSLLNTFNQMSLVDLHGSRKKKERAPGGLPDENVFGIDQGIAISLLRKWPRSSASRLERADLWGARADKLAAVAEPEHALTWNELLPQVPDYSFQHREQSAGRADYQRALRLPEIMPVSSTAAVTARDWFVIGFTPEELLARMQIFCDAAWSDDALRERFFYRTRSRRYPAGDTRSWKLAAAREHARAIGDFRPLIRRCLYRPFDWRFVLWADWMIDWPREESMRHLLAGGNLALVTRRQMLADQPANYFYVADAVVIDGLIRSDNRGSEAFFPLSLREDAGLFAGNPPVNFHDDFWNAVTRLAEQPQIAPADVLAMIYAQWHATAYRELFHGELCRDFPRVFLPRDRDVYARLVELGQRLIDAHLLRGAALSNPTLLDPAALDSAAPVSLPHRDWPQFRGDAIWLNDVVNLPGVAAEVWDYCVGGYQVCRKWLRDRAGRSLTVEELQHYQRIVAAVRASLAAAKEIDLLIAQRGGWVNCFNGADRPVFAAGRS